MLFILLLLCLPLQAQYFSTLDTVPVVQNVWNSQSIEGYYTRYDIKSIEDKAVANAYEYLNGFQTRAYLYGGIAAFQVDGIVPGGPLYGAAILRDGWIDFFATAGYTSYEPSGGGTEKRYTFSISAGSKLANTFHLLLGLSYFTTTNTANGELAPTGTILVPIVKLGKFELGLMGQVAPTFKGFVGVNGALTASYQIQ